MPDVHPHSTHRYALWLGFLILLIGFLYAGFVMLGGTAAPPTTTVQISPISAAFPKTAPPPTANNFVSFQHGFQYLVSYTGSGFMPPALSAKTGETVRFTNNSAGQVQISLANAMSPMLARGQYWEYTLPATSTKQFTYSANGSTGSLKIK